MIRRTDDEVLAAAVRAMRHMEAVGYTSLARHIGTTAKRLKRLIEASKDLYLIEGARLHKRLQLDPRSTESTWVTGIWNSAKGVDLHRVQLDATYVVNYQR